MSRRSFDSLFSEHSDDETGSPTNDPSAQDDLVADPSPGRIVRGQHPSIPGLWVFPSLLPYELASLALESISRADLFSSGSRDQVMLFSAPPVLATTSSLPQYITALLASLATLLDPLLPSETWGLVFEQTLARQAILNLYEVGRGITPHVDLPNRYADGILGVSLTGGCIMDFSHTRSGEERVERVYLPPRSVYVLAGEARWDWAHGITGREEDVVVNEKGGEETILRDLRVSVTFRWMKDGADVLS